MIFKNSILTLVLAGALSSVSSAAILINEKFNYTNGNLVGQGGWVVDAGTANPIQVSSGAAMLSSGTGNRQDISRALGAGLDGGKIYASFDVTVTSFTTQVYFAHFRQEDFAGAGKIWVAAPTDGGAFSFGIGDDSSPSTRIGTNLTLGTTYRLVVAYDYDAGTTSMWLNPESEASAHVTSTFLNAEKFVEYFTLRQASGPSNQTLDNLVVATTFSEVAPVPEPSAALLAVLGGCALFRRRR